MVKVLLRLEGLVIFGLSVWLYNQMSMGWVVYVVLFLVPDVSMVGYLVNQTLGARGYNLVHSYVLVGLLVVVAEMMKSEWLLVAALILMGHIGLDRTLGFGLKYAEGFKMTHLQRV